MSAKHHIYVSTRWGMKHETMKVKDCFILCRMGRTTGKSCICVLHRNPGAHHTIYCRFYRAQKSVYRPMRVYCSGCDVYPVVYVCYHVSILHRHVRRTVRCRLTACPYTCGICHKRYPYPGRLRNHFIANH